MSRTSLGLIFLCLMVAVGSTARAQDLLECLNNSELVGTCFDSGPISNAADEHFSNLLEEYATEGAGIWTPSATERFQGYLSK